MNLRASRPRPGLDLLKSKTSPLNDSESGIEDTIQADRSKVTSWGQSRKTVVLLVPCDEVP